MKNSLNNRNHFKLIKFEMVQGLHGLHMFTYILQLAFWHNRRAAVNAFAVKTIFIYILVVVWFLFGLDGL